MAAELPVQDLRISRDALDEMRRGLVNPRLLCDIGVMSNKEIVANLLKQLPDSGSLYEVAREIEFVAGWREGFESHGREGGTTIKERVLL